MNVCSFEQSYLLTLPPPEGTAHRPPTALSLSWVALHFILISSLIVIHFPPLSDIKTPSSLYICLELWIQQAFETQQLILNTVNAWWWITVWLVIKSKYPEYHWHKFIFPKSSTLFSGFLSQQIAGWLWAVYLNFSCFTFLNQELKEMVKVYTSWGSFEY